MGIFASLFEGSQFPEDAASLDQFFRQYTPNTRAYDLGVIAYAIAAVFELVGEAVLITHSQGGSPVWQTALRSQNVKGIISFELGTEFVFPEGELSNVSIAVNDAAGIYLSQ